MTDEQTHMTLIGLTNYRGSGQPFGIHDPDRLHHLYAVGKTGTGKSTLLVNMALSDIQRGKGVAVVDPHGDVVEALLDRIPEERCAAVFHLDAAAEPPLTLNPLAGIAPPERARVASELVAIFKRIWLSSWGPRLEYILRYSLLTLLEREGSTLLDIQPLLTDPAFRSRVLLQVTDPAVLHFWLSEFERYPPTLRVEATSSILNKTGLFHTAPLRGILGSPVPSLSLPDVLARGEVLLLSLPKGLIGEEAAAILGSLVVSQLQLAAMGRAVLPPAARTPFYLYVDEMQSFVAPSFIGILSECRKFGLSVFLANQYLDQLDEGLRAALLGNVGTLISFRVGTEDAAFLAREMAPVFSPADFVSLEKFAVYLRLVIDGVPSRPFSAVTLPLAEAGKPRARVAARRQPADSRPRAVVEGTRHGQPPPPRPPVQPGLFDAGSSGG